MKKISIIDHEILAPIIVEQEALEGIKIVAKKSVEDIERVCDKKVEILERLPKQAKSIIIYATLDHSLLLKDLEDRGKISIEGVRGKREVYGIAIIEKPWDMIEQALVVYGSDKRGTIYGIFQLSEFMGVSPLIFWGDVKPEKKQSLIFGKEIEMVSKEPSIEYRGFFINDEWPCFGTWSFEHFGGFTADMYDHVFELLLRLKGNYLWPAMWSSSFALDGPGDKNAQLADTYGIVIGNSHHEPCLRAGEEWDLYRGEGSCYGNEWNYVTNKSGLLNYWRDGLIRSGIYESIVTIGMRGERDSVMLGPSSLAENIEVLKDIIFNQEELIKEYVDNEQKRVPRLLALYKEVETYFYGSKQVKGLKDWEGLKDTILLLCEDNFGNIRSLPDDSMRNHKGGYGMYYHLDYHGAPISYEWVNSTPLSKIWEQMSDVYEYGVRKVWIVNVGDLKGNEFPLSYFLDLSYDFDTWGTSAINCTKEYTKKWLRKQFGQKIEEELIEQLEEVLTGYIYLNSLRRPEALRSNTYHPVHEKEADRIINQALEICEKAEYLKIKLPTRCQSAYFSMIYYPLMSSMNLLLMNLYAGKNEHYAKQGKKLANWYEEKVREAIKRDRNLSEEFGKILNGKWKGMELEEHIGFVKWNEDGCRYPLRITVEPFHRPRMVISRNDREKIAVKNYGKPDKIEVEDFLSMGVESVEIEVANDGVGRYLCKLEAESCDWLTWDWEEKVIEEQEILHIYCVKDKIRGRQEHSIYLTDGDGIVEIHIIAQNEKQEEVPSMTFFERNGVITIHPEHFAFSESKEGAEWKLLEGYGKTGKALKVFPTTKQFLEEEGPSITYYIFVEEQRNYQMEIWSAPSNPRKPDGKLRFGIGVNGEKRIVNSISDTYCSGEPENKEWSQGVLDQVHKSIVEVQLNEGVNEIKIYAIDSGFVLEKLIFYKKENPYLDCYLGPQESFYIR